eukprot:TRINITY_DN4454_c0_g2_i3.p1 TRINITY_DN4454_c0_g2~~TRINITY_DN4454_c0_g2_i3.p1  ORF type:complete len:498 (-),score=144.78 TRINITY_DN4454_c0_g2_i3:97-1491(-)
MYENRAFDHMLGWLKAEMPDLDGLDGTESNPFDPKDPSAGVVKVSATGRIYETPNGGHSYTSTATEVFGALNQTHDAPTMQGFVHNEYITTKNKTAAERIMACQPTSNLPVMTTMAKEFGLIDKWFAGHPGPTEVNRMFLHSCSSHGWVDNPDDVEYVQGFPQKAIYNLLAEHNVTFRIYMADDISTIMFYDSMRNVDMLSHFRSFESFLEDAKNGDLPQFSYIEPRFFSMPDFPSTDMHPPEHSLYSGELFLKQIYDAVRQGPLWNESALLMTYDEHGGLFDHVSPPSKGVPSPDDIPGKEFGFKFDRLGVRVPALLASPWLPKGTVEHEPTGPTPTSQYSHSSLMATLADIFDVSATLTKRDAWAGSFAHLFTKLSEPRTDCPESMPHPATLTAEEEEMHRVEYAGPVHDFHRSTMIGAAALNNESVSHTFLQSATELEGALFCREHVTRFFAKHGLKHPNH